MIRRRWVLSLSGVVCGVVCGFVCGALPTTARAQSASSAPPSGYAPLQPTGHGLAPLQRSFPTAVAPKRADEALLEVAAAARLSITFASDLPALRTRVSLVAGTRSVAVALLDIAEQAALRVLVSANGQLLVEARPPSRPVASRPPLHAGARRDSTRAQPLEVVRVSQAATSRERAGLTGRAGISEVTVSVDAMRATPSFVEPDVLRALQTMPGVSARSDWTAGFNVHGGEADQTLTLLDGYPIYNPYHLGGVFSAFLDPLVGDVEFHTGVLPARYGGRLSGALDVQTRTPTSDTLHGVSSVSLLSASTSLGRRFAEGRGSFIVGARRSYADAVVGLFSNQSFPFHLQDVQGRVTMEPGHGWRMAATVYASEDQLQREAIDVDAAGWRNLVGGVTLSRRIGRTPPVRVAAGDSTVWEQRVSATRFASEIAAPDSPTEVRNSVSDVRASGTLSRYHGGVRRTTIGYELARQRLLYDATIDESDFIDLVPVESSAARVRSGAVHMSHLLQPTPALTFDLGLRFEAVDGRARAQLLPRVAASYRLGATSIVRAGLGQYRQWLHSLGREESPVQSFQFWTATTAPRELSAATDGMVSAEHWWAAHRFVRATAYVKEYGPLLVPNLSSDARVNHDELQRVTGSAYGVDLLIRQVEGARFSGWLAYSWMHSWRADSLGARYASMMDKRHSIDAVGQWRRGTVTYGVRAAVASGAPYTPSLGGYARLGYVSGGRPRFTDDRSTELLVGARASARLPIYQRVDVSAARVWQLGPFSTTGTVSVLNVMNTRNAAAYAYAFDGRANRASLPNLPFLPTVGLSLAY